MNDRRSKGQRKHIIMAAEKRSRYTDAVLLGVNRYAGRHGHWLVQETNSAGALADNLRSWRVDGVLLRGAETLPVGHALFRKRCPVVEYDQRQPASRFPCVSADHYASGRIAAEHLIGLGFEHFACFAQPHHFSDQLARRGCCSSLQEAGRTWQELRLPRLPGGAWSLNKLVGSIMRFLAKQPLPLAVWLGADSNIVRFYDACDRLGLRIPEDVAFIGRGNQAVLCDTVWPSLSSVDLNAAEVGFQAARLLDRLMQGEAPPEVPILVHTGEVVTRMSTDVLAVADPLIAAALRVMRRHTADPVTVAQICRQIGVSRRKLEPRFRQVVGRTPAKEMRRLRIERAKLLLRRSDNKLTQVALECGYSDYTNFCSSFQQETGLAPVAWARAQTQ